MRKEKKRGGFLKTEKLHEPEDVRHQMKREFWKEEQETGNERAGDIERRQERVFFFFSFCLVFFSFLLGWVGGGGASTLRNLTSRGSKEENKERR